MDDKQLYKQLLGVEEPWQVSRVELDVATEEVFVHVECETGEVGLVCPECRQKCAGHDSREERQWRHLDSCGFSTYLVARVPRVRCPEHGVKTVAVPWSPPHSRFTVAFECFAIKVLQSTMVQSKAASLLRLGSGQVREIMNRSVQRGLSRRNEETPQPIKHVSMDEKSFKKGHQYISVLGDSESCRVLEVTEGRSVEAGKQLIEQGLTPSQRAKVESVTMDMWAPYMRAQQEMLPTADIVHDRFHVAKYLGDAVDKTRREEQRQLGAANQPGSPLHKTKYLWLTRPENLSPMKRALLNTVRDYNLETGKVWMYKEAFRDFYTAGNVTEAKTFFINWREFAIELGNKFLTKVAYMLDDHQRGLLNYHFHHTSNATAEGLNSQIQQVKANARGFRKFHNFRTAILFFLGRLDLYPQTSS